MAQLEPRNLLMGQATTGRQLLLVEPGYLSEHAQALPGPLGVAPPGRFHSSPLGGLLDCRQVRRIDAPPTIDAPRGQETPADPALDRPGRDLGALCRLRDRQELCARRGVAWHHSAPGSLAPAAQRMPASSVRETPTPRTPPVGDQSRARRGRCCARGPVD